MVLTGQLLTRLFHQMTKGNRNSPFQEKYKEPKLSPGATCKSNHLRKNSFCFSSFLPTKIILEIIVPNLLGLMSQSTVWVPEGPKTSEERGPCTARITCFSGHLQAVYPQPRGSDQVPSEVRLLWPVHCKIRHGYPS